eukprot:3123060-Prymnesium_polylepis.1
MADPALPWPLPLLLPLPALPLFRWRVLREDSSALEPPRRAVTPEALAPKLSARFTLYTDS